MKLGSLFDGSGGFPLAGTLCGVEPVWASEVEPYPIAVTKSRFPKMKHLGDITNVNGAEIEPVDIITFGSPCQDLSVAGKRAGLKHEENGDEETTRSGLFMESIRIIKEMRCATNGAYPRFAFWENVPGAFSSNKGEDFRIVLEELIKIVEPSAKVPSADKNGWSYADVYVGDGWSLAYRTLDAQYWGVPQRRRRIHLVADFAGECAGEILFECEGLRGDPAQSRETRQGIATDAQRGIEADDRKGKCINGQLILDDQGGGKSGANVSEEVAPTLTCTHGGEPAVAYWDGSQTCGTLTANNAGGNQRMPDKEQFNCVIEQKEEPIVLDRAFYNQGQNAQAVCYGINCRNMTEYPELYPTLQSKPNGGQSLNFSGAVRVRYIVRRLTPTECARFQGFPDDWGHPDAKTELTDEDFAFWHEVRNTHERINGKKIGTYSREQMLKWYNKLHTDSSEYKMWGNGIALPPALYVMRGIVDALTKRGDENAV